MNELLETNVLLCIFFWISTLMFLAFIIVLVFKHTRNVLFCTIDTYLYTLHLVCKKDAKKLDLES